MANLDKGAAVELLLNIFEDDRKREAQLGKEKNLAVFKQMLEQQTSTGGLSQISGLGNQLNDILADAIAKMQEAGIDLTQAGSDPETQKAFAQINANFNQRLQGLMLSASVMGQLFRSAGQTREASAFEEFSNSLPKLNLINMLSTGTLLREGAPGSAKGQKQVSLERQAATQIAGPGIDVRRGEEGKPAQPGSLKVTGGPKGGFEGTGAIDKILEALKAFPAQVAQVPAAEDTSTQPLNVRTSAGDIQIPGASQRGLSTLFGTPNPISSDEIISNIPPVDINDMIMSTLGF